jgi:hypothetical protein
MIITDFLIALKASFEIYSMDARTLSVRHKDQSLSKEGVISPLRGTSATVISSSQWN